MELSIVIPYYKRRYLGQVLESLRHQTDRNFEILMGDDASTEDPGEILTAYGDLGIRYVRFPENLGRDSPARQWNRCVGMSDTKWVWLMSDDDVISADAVESWRRSLKEGGEAVEVYRFQSSVIDGEGGWVRDNVTHPEHELAEDLVEARFCGGREYYIQDHLFARSTFEREGGFVELPYGLFSDDATWMRFSARGGVRTVNGGRFCWRTSPLQFSARGTGRFERRLDSFFGYCRMAEEFLRGRGRDTGRFRQGSMEWMLRVMPELADRVGWRSVMRLIRFGMGWSPKHAVTLGRRAVYLRRRARHLA